MTVITFPGPRPPIRHLKPDPALYLVAALRRLGEPVTLPELGFVVREVSDDPGDWTDAHLGSILERLRETGSMRCPKRPCFAPCSSYQARRGRSPRLFARC